jgi:photosystem II stability/assembly factor-like uncharacterized protein
VSAESLARALRFTSATALSLFGVLLFTNCPPSPSPVPVATLEEFKTDIPRAGRMVAVTVSAADKQIALAAGESGGLFRTTDGGNSWQHVDGLPPFRIVDVAFAEPGATNTRVVIATAIKDAHLNAVANNGGIWRSDDAGLTWTHIALPASCPPPQSAHGIAYVSASTVFVAADCGVLSSSDLGATWAPILNEPARSVVAHTSGNNTLIDVCLQERAHRRSTDGGTTWSAKHPGPTCETAHAIAVSPLESNVLFATFARAPGTGLSESDDGGQSWIDLGATAYNERPVWVRTRQAIDQNATHFDLYFPGRRVTCTNSLTGQRCPTNAMETWFRVPASGLNHDLNGLAFDPWGRCPLLMVADYGVYRAATAPPPTCGADADWVHVGRASTGVGSLQIYQVAGQLHYPITGGGWFTSGYTNLFIGTMDNWLWANHDVGEHGWQGFGIEGSFLQTLYKAAIAPASDLQLTYMEFGSRGTAKKIRPNLQTGAWSQPSDWTAITPPGNGTAPVLISAHTYVQWSGATLLLTTDGGATWSTLGMLPARPTGPLNILQFGSSQVTKTSAGPALYEFVTDSAGSSGLALITNLSPTTTPRILEVRTLGGINNRGFSSGLRGIMGNCFGSGAWYCQPVYAADPNDYRNLIAADPVQKIMSRSTDAGQTWQASLGLTNLVTAAGALSFTDAIGACQAHTIAYDPGNSAHVLVGTDQAGIIASANGGLTWSALPSTSMATAISSIFFDDRANVVYVATYGRGLWKLTIDWNSLAPTPAPSPSPKVTVPDVIRFTAIQAGDRIRAAGLAPVLRGPQGPTARVTRQVPVSGTLVNQGTRVTAFLEVTD